jgi:hypothetical protein
MLSVRPRRTGMRVLPATTITLLALGCAAEQPMFDTERTAAAFAARVVVLRTSQIGGGAGSWVPMQVELNDRVVGKVSDHSRLVVPITPGEFDLSVTPMINLHYSPGNRMSLREYVTAGEVAHFLIVTVFGQTCPTVYATEGVGSVASTQQSPRPGWTQTTCLARVPREVASSALPEPSPVQ